MAVVKHAGVQIMPGAFQTLWETLTNGDTGSVQQVRGSQLTVTATGTFNSQTVTLQGSNDNSVWFSLTRAGDADLFADADGLGVVSFAAAGGAKIHESPRYIRPSFSGSSGGDVDVILIDRG